MTAKIKKILLAVAALAALALGGAALADATSGGNDSATQEQTDTSDRGDRGEHSDAGDHGLPADLAARARAAAAQATGGQPGATERDGENGATYEVEVTRPDGSQADVRLDEQFEVVVVEDDSED
jgi:uncharacterized membrane protein YkoI